MKTLRPIVIKANYPRPIEKKLNEFLYKLIYQRIAEIIHSRLNQKLNVSSALLNAILKGRIQYIDGKFRGEFSASISNELRSYGAKFNKSEKAWALDRAQVPSELLSAIGSASSLYENVNKQIISHIDAVNVDNVINDLDLTDQFLSLLTVTERDFKSSIQGISVAPDLRPEILDGLTEDFNNNMKLSIKGWAEEHIVKLREDVTRNAFEGYRAEGLVQEIQKNFGVTQSKAKFLARQETSLLLSKYKEQRYKDAGMRRYRWSDSRDGRVRDDHKDLNGKIFDWDDPPVTNKRTGARNHPGEDFGCRCIARPIVE